MTSSADPGRVPAADPQPADAGPSPRLARVGKKLKASAAEVAANPRARSAILRVAERLPVDA